MGNTGGSSNARKKNHKKKTDAIPLPKITTTTDETFDLSGVKLSFLKKWSEENVTSFVETTAQVCTRIVLKETNERKCTMLEKWNFPTQANANRFVSHSWSYPFRIVIDTLVEQEVANGSNLDEVFVWLDTFVVNQHTAPKRPQSWWSNVFHTAIERIGTVVVVLHPWSDPKVLTRAWCLWEVYGAAKSNSKLHIALHSSARNDFLRTLVQDFKKIQNVLSLVDSERAEASNANDLKMIREVILTTIGFEGINRMVLSQLRAWLVRSALFAIEQLSAENSDFLSDAGLLPANRKESIALLHNQVARLYNQQGELMLAIEHQSIALRMDLEINSKPGNIARNYNNLGYLYSHIGRFEEGLENLNKALEIRKNDAQEQGEGKEYAHTLHNIAEILETTGKYELALEKFVAAAKILEVKSGSDEALKVYCACGRVCRLLGRYKESEGFFLYAISLKDLNKKHPDYADCLGAFAALLTDIDCLVEAKTYLLDCLKLQERNYGELHPNVADVHNFLARVHAKLGEYEEGLKSQQKSLEINLKVYPSMHLTLARDYNNLGYLYMTLDDLEKASENMLKCLAIREKMISKSHPLYLQTLCNYSHCLVIQGKFAEAETNFNLCLAQYAKEHPNLGEIYLEFANSLYLQGRFDEAEGKLNEAISMELNPLTCKINCMLLLVKCLCDKNDFGKCAALFERVETTCLGLFKKTEGIKNPFEIEISSGKARYYEAIGEHERSMTEQEHCLQLHKEKKVFSLDYAKDLNNYGYLLAIRPTSMNALKKAVDALEQSLQIREKNPSTIRTKYNKGMALCEMKNYSLGKRLLGECIESMEEERTNKFNIFVAKLGLMKIEMFLDSKTTVTFENELLLLFDNVPQDHPTRIIYSFLTAYAKKELDEMKLKMNEYFEKENQKCDINFPLFYILVGQLENDDGEKSKSFHRAKEICLNELGLMKEHRFVDFVSKR